MKLGTLGAAVIKRFKNKGLAELFEHGDTAKIGKRFHDRLIQCLDALDAAQAPGDMDLPGYKLHPLQGFNPTRWSVWITGAWRVTFEFDGVNADLVNFEQYH